MPKRKHFFGRCSLRLAHWLYTDFQYFFYVGEEDAKLHQQNGADPQFQLTNCNLFANTCLGHLPVLCQLLKTQPFQLTGQTHPHLLLPSKRKIKCFPKWEIIGKYFTFHKTTYFHWGYFFLLAYKEPPQWLVTFWNLIRVMRKHDLTNILTISYGQTDGIYTCWVYNLQCRLDPSGR